jgi:cytochrome c-type biogenesis protein CcsB
MTTRAPLWFSLGAAASAALAALILVMLLGRTTTAPSELPDGEFARAVDLTPLDRSAVLASGRIKSYDSFASEMLSLVGGRNRLRGLPPDFAYLDLMFRPAVYADAPIIFVKNPNVREQIIAALADDSGGEPLLTEDAKSLLRSKGLVTQSVARSPQVEELLQRLSMDVVRTAKVVDAIRTALTLTDPRVLREQLRMIPPPSGRADERWTAVSSIWGSDFLAGPDGDVALPGVDPALVTEMRVAWSALAKSWQAQDAAGVNAAIVQLAGLFPKVSPGLYPDQGRMLLESWYFKSMHMTWIWVIYLLSVALLLMAVVYRWDRARWLGAGAFTVALALHTVALGWRWYAAGRWPNSNMFEAVTTSVWLGTLVVVAIELWARRTPMRNIFMLGGAGASMCAMMAAHYVPELNASINNMMPVLHDLWLYIHTNVIIASYALIAMAAVTALLYLAYRAVGGEATYARVGGAAALLEVESSDPALRPRRSPGEVFDGATMVLMELSFVMLWAGIVMGAIWADHSWGRPWGWDPKEVFALNTFIVFLVLVHIRLKARDKGLWTAVLAVIGCGVMLFNWIVINFIISGLHSYA